jgi:Fur family ferric uptake transcriptional regulator
LKHPVEILRQYNLKDTQSRRLVLKAFMNTQKPLTQKEIYKWICNQDATTNLVTVYRTLQLFKDAGIIHRHPSSGGFLLCTVDDDGCHSFLSCSDCGKVEEFCDVQCCSTKSTIAKRAGFTPTEHVSEIIGVCAACL